MCVSLIFDDVEIIRKLAALFSCLSGSICYNKGMPSSESIREVFVYGSLMSDKSNHKYFLLDAEDWGPAVTVEPKYDLVCLGGFPGVLPDGECGVIGELYTVDDDTFERLDTLESNGVMYRRELVPVALQDGVVVDAWMYIFLGEPWARRNGENVVEYQTDAGFFVQKWTGPNALHYLGKDW